ncbi:MAG: hypothetical protein KKH01_07585 [Firmicutes bacterium]|nr:hypothetical protein [Bacillota bacterium]
MKIRFYNNALNVLTMTIVEISFIFFIGLTIHLNSIIMLIIGTVGFLTGLIMLVLFIQKHFYKVEINNKGITWFFRKRNTVFIKWEDIDSLRGSSEWRIGSVRVDSKMIDNKNLYFNVNYFRLKKIISICPIDDLKIQLKKTRIFYTESKSLNKKDK